MNGSHEDYDSHDEMQLEHLLKSGHPSSQPSAEFQEALLRQLNQVYARTHIEVGSTLDELQLPSKALEAANSEYSDHSVTSSYRPKVTLRVAMTMAAAASLLFVVALWNSQTAYGWAAMLRALENCDWVQAVSETSGLRGWVSSQRGFVAVQSKDQVAFLDEGKRMSSQYLSDRQVIYQQALPGNADPLGPEELFGLWLSKSGSSESTLGHSLSGLQVVTESWRRITSRNDSQELIELRVTLTTSGDKPTTYKLLILLNPQTKLPQTVQLLNHANADQGNGDWEVADRSLVFDYPTEGPGSIFALGVPEETNFVTSLAQLQEIVPSAAREAATGMVLRQAAKKSPQQDRPLLAKKSAASPPKNNYFSRNEKTQEKIAANPAPQLVEADEVVTQPLVKEPVQSGIESNKVDHIASNPIRAREVWVGLELPEEPLEQTALVDQVNQDLATCWAAQGIAAAAAASDTEFLRRVYLDLTGRIPFVSEVYEFLEDPRENRRELLVDDLLASRDHATHLATVWRKLLLPDGVDTNVYGGTNKFDQWLADRFEQNLPYDQLVRQLLLAEGRVSDSGPILFYAALKLNPEELAAKTARTFLGMRMECAQCHDHPFDDSIAQEDFWGFAAHFAQISRPKGKIEMTSSVLRVRDNKRGEVTLPDTEDVVPPQLPYKIRTAKLAQENEGDVSRRQTLVDWLTHKQNGRFARATVNRAWQHLFGQGLVEPVDDMRADNLPTCPEALDTLSLDFAASGYDLRRLLRTLVLSDAYQLSSRAATDEPSQALVFARMNIKSFSADQLYDCINVATEPASMRGGQGMNNGAVNRINNSSRQAFIEQFRAPPGQRTDYHAGIPQALTLMHGYLVHGATDLASSGLLKKLNAPFMNNEQRVETLFLATLSRLPDETEKEKMLSYINASTTDTERSRALGDILWALLNSAEFTFIH